VSDMHKIAFLACVSLLVIFGMSCAAPVATPTATPTPTRAPTPTPTATATLAPQPTPATTRIASGVPATLELPGYGAVAIPSLLGDWTAAISAQAQLSKALPADWIVTVGPVLSLSLKRARSSVLPGRPRVALASTRSQPRLEDGSMQFVIDFSRSTAKGYEGAVPIAHITLKVDKEAFVGLPGTVDTAARKATVTVPKELVARFDESDNLTVDIGLATVRQPLTSAPRPHGMAPRCGTGKSGWTSQPGSTATRRPSCLSMAS
jgi:hypothetical protein